MDNVGIISILSRVCESISHTEMASLYLTCQQGNLCSRKLILADLAKPTNATAAAC